MTRNRTIPPNYSFDGNTIADLIVKQYMSDVANDTSSYESIVGEKIDGLTTIAGEQSARRAAQDLSNKLRGKGFSNSFIKKWIREGLQANTRTGTGVRVYKDGSITEFNVNPKPPKSKRNRFSFGNATDIDALVGTAGVTVVNNYDKGDLKAYEPPAKGGKGGKGSKGGKPASLPGPKDGAPKEGDPECKQS